MGGYGSCEFSYCVYLRCTWQLILLLQWFKCDDAWITKATAEEVLASEG